MYGNGYIEVKPKGVKKEQLVEKMLQGKIFDFVFFIGNDSSDEPVFEKLKNQNSSFFQKDCEKFLCILEKKPSNADFYIENIDQIRLLFEKFLYKT